MKTILTCSLPCEDDHESMVAAAESFWLPIFEANPLPYQKLISDLHNFYNEGYLSTSLPKRYKSQDIVYDCVFEIFEQIGDEDWWETQDTYLSPSYMNEYFVEVFGDLALTEAYESYEEWVYDTN